MSYSSLCYCILRYYFLRNWRILSQMSNVFQYFGQNILLLKFWYLQSQQDIPYFVADINNLFLFSLFLLSLSGLIEIYQFYWSFQRSSFIFHLFSLLFFCFWFHWFLVLYLLFPTLSLFCVYFPFLFLVSWDDGLSCLFIYYIYIAMLYIGPLDVWVRFVMRHPRFPWNISTNIKHAGPMHSLDCAYDF